MQTRWIVLIGVVTARVAFAFQLQTVAVIAPGLMHSFGFDAVAIGILTGLFMLPGLVFAIPSGMLSQKIGERPFLIGCLVALTAGGAVCAIADSYWALWAGRLISGFGAIGINVAMSKIVIDWFADKELNTAMALFLTGFPAGIALALVSLGYWATPEGWPIAFFVAAGFSFLALILFVLTYRPATGTGVQETVKVRLSLGEFGMVCVSGLMWAFYNAGFIIVVSFVPLYLVGEGLSAGVAASLVGVGMWIALIAGPFGGVIADRLNQPNLLISASVLIWGFGALLVMPLSNSIPLLAMLFAGFQSGAEIRDHILSAEDPVQVDLPHLAGIGASHVLPFPLAVLGRELDVEQLLRSLAALGVRSGDGPAELRRQRRRREKNRRRDA